MSPLSAPARDAEYARLRALVELRLGELRAALARHEDERRDDHELLGRIEAELARLTARLDAWP